MNRLTKTILLGVFTIAWFVAAFIYVKSMNIIGYQYVPEVRQLVAVTDADSLKEGERLARVYGCFDACHGERMDGNVVYEHALNGRLVAPNLTRSVRQRTLPELEAIVRQGIGPDGTSVFVMPSASFAAMTDQELSAILAFIRSNPEQLTRQPETDYGLLTRWRMVMGGLPAQATLGFQQPWRETFRANEARLGEYVATVACTQCHGLDFEGQGAVPSLRAMNDYDEFEFVKLMKEGMGPGDRPVNQKAGLASSRYVHLTDEEIEALFLFLKTRP